MQSIGRYYVQYFNHCYKRTGGLWEGRYRATLIDSNHYLFSCMRYIELNPARANNMAAHPSEYPWSSYHCNARDETNILITPHDEYLQLGKTTHERATAYLQMFDTDLSSSILSNIRDSTNKAWVLGGEQFKQQMALKLNRPIASRGRGGDRRSQKYLDSL